MMLSCKKCKCATYLVPGEVFPSQAKGMIVEESETQWGFQLLHTTMHAEKKWSNSRTDVIRVTLYVNRR